MSCELLSFFSIFGIQNNKSIVESIRVQVVNCFHFSVSLGYKTTPYDLSKSFKMLWIAFIFQYLWDTKQHTHFFPKVPSRCELLSFFSIFGIQNNIVSRRSTLCIVVNCFHFSVSLGYKTTQWAFNVSVYLLWIAFIFQYLWDTKQHAIYLDFLEFCCELLSFFSIFGIQNNLMSFNIPLSFVVNCFHFSVSLGYKTTN